MALLRRFGWIFMTISFSVMAADPDYSAWNQILTTHYNPSRGMDYKGLKAKDEAKLKTLVQVMAKINVSSLNSKEQLAYWMNLYNITTVNLIIDNPDTKSIRDLSTDPIIRTNIFKKDLVQHAGGRMSLKYLEDEIIRKQFKDPRIHFAINCAARSCPPMRMEAFVGSRVEAQLDDQARTFFANPVLGARCEEKSEKLIIRLTKIMDSGFWFAEDFEKWGGGRVAFVRRCVSPDKQQLIDKYAGKIKLEFDSYNWELNRWNR